MADKNTEVFFTDIRQTRERYSGFCPGLSAAEREKADRFLREDDRLRFITGRCIIRTLAAERLGMTSPEILLTECGKPYIGGAENFRFNISHSGDLVVLAVSDSPVGIDIEQHTAIEWRELSASFGSAEREILNSTSDPISCFYRIWTIRGAFAKAEGTGLPLFDSASPRIDYPHGTVHYNGNTLYFTAWEKDGYSVCVCGAYTVPDNNIIPTELMII